MGPEAKAAAPAFIEAVKDFDGYVRHEAIKALGRLGADARPAIPILMKELENPRMHNTAIAALMGIVVGMQRANHPDTKQLVETLKNAFENHPDPKINRYAFAVEDMVRREKQRIR